MLAGGGGSVLTKHTQSCTVSESAAVWIREAPLSSVFSEDLNMCRVARQDTQCDVAAWAVNNRPQASHAPQEVYHCQQKDHHPRGELWIKSCDSHLCVHSVHFTFRARHSPGILNQRWASENTQWAVEAVVLPHGYIIMIAIQS